MTSELERALKHAESIRTAGVIHPYSMKTLQKALQNIVILADELIRIRSLVKQESFTLGDLLKSEARRSKPSRYERIEWLFRKKLGESLNARGAEWLANYERMRGDRNATLLYSNTAELIRELTCGIRTLALKPDFSKPAAEEEMEHYRAMEQMLIDEGKI